MNIVDWVSSRFESLRERYGERRFYPLFWAACFWWASFRFSCRAFPTDTISITICLASTPWT